MLFNSYIFLFLFLPVTFFLYSLLANKKKFLNLGSGFLLAASLFFYAYWDLRYLPLLLMSIIFNHYYAVYLLRSRESQKTTVLFWGVLINLSPLFLFKYYDFVVLNLNKISDLQFPLLRLTLPLAISFYTFLQIAYLVDCKNVKNVIPSFKDFALFVVYFPHLISGPLVHHKRLIPQFRSKFISNDLKIQNGLQLLAVGLFKKVVIADNLSPYVSVIFDSTVKPNLIAAWFSALFYTFQLYFDFSGYSDMAVGISWLFGIDLPYNFNSPYQSTSIKEFWKNWHITLSNWLKEYIYIPLGGNKNGDLRTVTNLLITFLIGGIWHGAGWPFMFWGLLNGVGLAIHYVWQKTEFILPSKVSLLLTFPFTVICWVFFRSKDVVDAFRVLGGMFTFNNVELGQFKSNFDVFIGLRISVTSWLCDIGLTNRQTELPFVLFILFFIVFKCSNSQQLVLSYGNKRWFNFYIGALFVLGLLHLNRVSEFLYFQF